MKTTTQMRFFTVVMMSMMGLTTIMGQSENQQEPATAIQASNTPTGGEVDFGDYAVFVSYYSFKGLYNIGASYTKMKANKIGYESNFRTNFKTDNNYNVDICANYTYVFTQKDDYVIGGKVALGPSFRTQSYTTVKVDEKTLQMKQSRESKNAVDLYFDAGFFCKYKRFFVFIGGTGWAPEWKFGEDYYHSGLHLSIGYSGLFK